MNPGYPGNQGYPPQPGYGYGYGYGGAPMGPQRPNTPRTLGTLSMVFGGLVTLLSLLNLATGGKLGSFTQVQESQRAAFDHYLEEVRGPSMAIAGMMMAMSIWLFVIGTGQRAYKRWAVKQSQIWAVVAFLSLAVNFIIQITVIMPALERFIQAISHGDVPTGPISMAMKIGAFVGLGFYAPWPIILLINFRKPAIIQAMDQPPQATPAAEVF